MASASALLFASVLPSEVPRPAVARPLVLWAWERPEDLRFLDPRHGVAVLVGSLDLTDGGIMARARRQPLAVPAKTAVTAVVRIEAASPLHEGQRDAAIDAIVAWSRLEGTAALQIDFDATVSQRRFYRALLVDLRRRLPASLPLSITALASWCLGDPWIAGLPVDEAVPMLFRMGADDAAVRRRLDGGGDFTLELCRSSVGVSTDEPLPRIPDGRRIFAFHPDSWTAPALRRLDRALEETTP